MPIYMICKGIEPGKKKPKRYIGKFDDNTGKALSFHRMKEKVYRWSRRYGPYNTIRQEAGSASFFKASKDEVVLNNVEIFEIIDSSVLEINCISI